MTRTLLPLCFDHRVEVWKRSGLPPEEIALITRLSWDDCLVCTGRFLGLDAQSLRAAVA